ncbi:MAG: pyridoxamine 5'-phosphate oxidase family protein [Promethearchaeota archaeon]
MNKNLNIKNTNLKKEKKNFEVVPRSKEEVLSDVLQYLNDHRILTMATCDLNGEPDASALEYANEQTTVFVSCRPNSKKVHNIKENPKVFYEIHDDVEITWENMKNLKALQVSATPQILYPNTKEFNKAFEIMLEKFPVFKNLKKESRVILKFTPKIIWFLNYRKKFFFREEVVMQEEK